MSRHEDSRHRRRRVHRIAPRRCPDRGRARGPGARLAAPPRPPRPPRLPAPRRRVRMGRGRRSPGPRRGARRHRRGLAPGGDGRVRHRHRPTRPRSSTTTISARPSCSRGLAARRFAGPLVLASSMVVYGEGATGAPRTARSARVREPCAALQAGQFDPPCPHCGAALEPAPIPETARLDPRTLYAATKLHQEHLAACFARDTPATVTALRYHNVYGPRMPRDTPYAGVASIFASALAGGAAPRVFEDGAQRRDFVHVRDVARANVLALTARGARRVQRRQRHPADDRGHGRRARRRLRRGRAAAGGHRRVPARGRAPRVRLARARRARARIRRAGGVLHRGGGVRPRAAAEPPDGRRAGGDRQGPAAGASKTRLCPPCTPAQAAALAAAALSDTLDVVDVGPGAPPRARAPRRRRPLAPAWARDPPPARGRARRPARAARSPTSASRRCSSAWTPRSSPPSCSAADSRRSASRRRAGPGATTAATGASACAPGIRRRSATSR